jgi:glycerol-3-phosphate acyltransferase PlsY
LLALVLLPLAYLCGAIPFGLLLARRAGVDVRRRGSGNIGATNVARTAGTGLGVATLVADALKGALPVLVARGLGAGLVLQAGTGLAALAGHVYPVTLRFRGGKGVATALGVLAVLSPPATAVAFIVFAAVVVLTRWVSLASILAATSTPAAAWLLGSPTPVVVASVLMAALVVWRHAENLRRLRAGTEPRFSLHKRQAARED